MIGRCEPAGVFPEASTCAIGQGGPVAILRYWVGSGLPRQLIVTCGRAAGSEQATALVFWSVTPPSIVCVAPWKLAAAESCALRQSGALARLAFALVTLFTVSPVAKA